MNPKAVFIDFKEDEIPSQYQERLKKVLWPKFIARDDSRLVEMLSDTEIIFAKIFTKIDKDLIDNTSDLKYIGVLSTAYDAIDTNYAKEKNIKVCNLGGYSTEAVAEFFFAGLFEVTRQLEKAKNQARNEDYSFDKFMGMELKEKTLGVVGAGKIGKRIAEIGMGIGMKVIYFSRNNKPEIEKLGAIKKDLDEVLSQSDFVSLNLSLNKETKGIISKDKINLLKKGCFINGDLIEEGCIFINLAPPELIDQEAMLSKLNSGEIVYIFDHADVDLKITKKFLESKNCIIYPPIAFRTKEADTTKWETFVSNIEEFLKGSTRNVVN